MSASPSPKRLRRSHDGIGEDESSPLLPAVSCVAAGRYHQGSSIYQGNNSQCTVIAAYAAIYSSLNSRAVLSSFEVDFILGCGDRLYLELKPLLPPGETYLMADDLPSEILVGNKLVKLADLKDNWIANGLYPKSHNSRNVALVDLKECLLTNVFNNDYNDDTDSVLFTGHNYTYSFWRHGNYYFFFNSHAVNRLNKNSVIGGPTRDEYVARLFKCNSVENLAELLFCNEIFDGTEYSLSRLRVLNQNSLLSPSQSILEQFHLNSIPSNCDNLPSDVTSPRNLVDLNRNPEIVKNNKADLKLTYLKPVVLLKNIDFNKVHQNKGGRPKKQKRGNTSNKTHLDAEEKHPQIQIGRPKKQKRGRISTKNNAHLDAAKKFAEKRPEVNRAAVRRYTESNPQVNRESVRRYTESKPEVHRDSVRRYTESNPEVHRDSVRRYTESNPEVHRESVRRYTENNPEVNRDSVRRYSELHPEVNQQAVQTYTQESRRIDRPLRRSIILIGERRGEDLKLVKLFTLKIKSLLSDQIYKCQYCRAPLFFEEKSRRQWCCHSGACNVQNFDQLNENFYSSPAFLSKPRAYNNIFAFSALGVSHGFHQPPSGISFIKIQGRVYHRIFDLSYNETPNNINFYINDSSEREILGDSLSLDRQVVREITGYIYEVNPYIQCFQRLSLEPSSQAFLRFEKTTRASHGNILGDQPVGREIAAIISTDREEFHPRCIAVKKVGEGRPRTIDIMHPLYEPFQFPLLYPHGNPGWHPDMLDNNGNKLNQVKYVRCLFLSEPRFSIFDRLSEEWLVDMYCRVIEERLRYLKYTQMNIQQNTLRVAPLQELMNDEFILGEGGIVPGRIYLPSSFTGGPRYMKVKYLDAIAIVNRLGPPSFFLTFTCNPRWPEIKESIVAGRKSNPLVCVRVFNLKLAELLRDLKSGKWFGKLVYIMHVIEFQKRGLPHAHIAFRVEGGGPVDSVDIDKFVCATIPDPKSDTLLHEAVLNHMVHGPCGPPYRTNLPCWDREKSKCSKYFPKKETPVTFCDDRGFIHLRRSSSNEASISYRGNAITVNDLWIVPYNPALLLKYDAHINLEVSTQRTVIKYLFKYMTKGPDEARVAVVNEEHRDDEIEQYVTKRYVSSSDAAWRVLEFDITGRNPTVKMLAVHLPDRNSVFFRPGQVGDAVDNAGSDLIDYFNRPLSDEFDRLTYLDFFEQYNVHAKDPGLKTVQAVPMQNGKFVTKRIRGELVARLFWVQPNRGEQFYLRILLSVYPTRSFDDLLSNVGGPDCSTFQEAAKRVGLADDEIEYERAMEEASSFYTGPRLRSFFVLLVVNGAPVASLYDTYKRQLAEDFIHRMPDDYDNAIRMALVQIDRLLRRHGTSLTEQGLPEVVDRVTELDRERVEYNFHSLRSFVDEWLPQLSHDQRTVFDYVNNLCVDVAFRESHNSAIFIDGPAGTGKTLLLNVVTAHVRSNCNGIVLTCASSAIAAQNYSNATTAHALFRFPLELVDDSGYWNITNGSQRAQLLYNATLIIYDEAPMAHKFLIHLLDRSLQDLMGSTKVFGGKTIIFAGDFRQIPPVVTGARTDSDILSCSMKTSHIWPGLKKFNLVTSQRCKEDPSYAEFLLQLGSNQITPQTLHIDNYVLQLVQLGSVDFVTQLEELIDFIFPDITLIEADVCCHRAILCTRNDSVREINSAILHRLPGDILHFYSIDKILSDNVDEVFFGADFLHTVRPNGVPDYDLQLKLGSVCMIMRNLSFSDGLVNGTKVIVVAASPHLIKVRKQDDLREYLIPRILFKAPIDRNSPYEMTRRQFPLQLCYAMTIHKSQGQTISRVGIDLRSNVFSHGQLYVALGRVREKRHIKLLLPRGRIFDNKPYSNNVVISELLK